MTQHPQSSFPLHQKMTYSNRKQHTNPVLGATNGNASAKKDNSKSMGSGKASATSANKFNNRYHSSYSPIQSPAGEWTRVQLASTKATSSSATSPLFRSPMVNNYNTYFKTSTGKKYYSPKTLFNDESQSSPAYMTPNSAAAAASSSSSSSSFKRKQQSHKSTTVTTNSSSKIYSTSTNKIKPKLDSRTLSVIQAELSKHYKTTLYSMAETISQCDDIINMYIFSYKQRCHHHHHHSQIKLSNFVMTLNEDKEEIMKRQEIEYAMNELIHKVNSFMIGISCWDDALKYLNAVFEIDENESYDDDHGKHEHEEDESQNNSSSQHQKTTHPLIQHNIQNQQQQPQQQQIPLGRNRYIHHIPKRKTPIKKQQNIKRNKQKIIRVTQPPISVGIPTKSLIHTFNDYLKEIHRKINPKEWKRISKFNTASKMISKNPVRRLGGANSGDVIIDGKSNNTTTTTTTIQSSNEHYNKSSTKSNKNNNSNDDDDDVDISLSEQLDRLMRDRVTDATRTARFKELRESKRIEKEIAQREEQQRIQEEEEERLKQEALEAASQLLRPLTDDEQMIVKDAMYGSGCADEIIASSDTDTVQRKSVRTLRPGCWLNDEVIHYFYLMLTRRDEASCKGQSEKKRSHFFKSFFLTKLFDEGGTDKYRYANVKRWSKRVPGKDIFELDKIFFPCNVRNTHWCCAVIFMQEKRIQFYDSMHGSGMYYMEGLMQYLKDEWSAKKGGDLPDADKWKLVACEPDVPQQNNGFDCGVFTCMFADFLSLDRPLSFSQEHITQCRERIALSIMKGVAIE